MHDGRSWWWFALTVVLSACAGKSDGNCSQPCSVENESTYTVLESCPGCTCGQRHTCINHCMVSVYDESCGSCDCNMGADAHDAVPSDVSCEQPCSVDGVSVYKKGQDCIYCHCGWTETCVNHCVVVSGESCGSCDCNMKPDTYSDAPYDVPLDALLDVPADVSLSTATAACYADCAKQKADCPSLSESKCHGLCEYVVAGLKAGACTDAQVAQWQCEAVALFVCATDTDVVAQPASVTECAAELSAKVAACGK